MYSVKIPFAGNEADVKFYFDDEDGYIITSFCVGGVDVSEELAGMYYADSHSYPNNAKVTGVLDYITYRNTKLFEKALAEEI